MRKTTLDDQGQDDLGSRYGLSPAQLVAMVRDLTVDAWTFKDGSWNEPRLRRDVVRAVRRWS